MTRCGYEVIRKLGAGTFGEVWLIPWEDGFAVLKVLKNPTQDNRERFAREARMLLRHRDNPHVLQLLHQEVDGAEPYFIVEHCDGGSLDKMLEAHGIWSATHVAYLIAHVAAGLDVIHIERGYHRDLKPANILLKWTNREIGEWIVKVGDFGLAREPDSRSATMTASPHGTPAYMPPEVLRGGAWTPAGDIYSLGITGIEMLTGSRERAGLRSDVGPTWLRDLLLAMTTAELRTRPSIQQVGMTVQVNLAPKQQIVARPSRKRQQRTNSGWGWLLGGMAAATALALATMNTEDANGRLHGNDGRFRSGRWG